MTTQPPDLSGMDWLDRFMHAQALVEGNTLFLTFKLGQLGALAATADRGDVPERVGRDRIRQVITDIETDAQDLIDAAERLASVTLDITANLRRNIGLDDA